MASDVAVKPRLRTCIACGAKSDKRSLVRVVRTPEGAVKLDESGKAAGRGAYVCSVECFERAEAAHKFERSLKTKIGKQDYDAIAAALGARACGNLE